MTVLMDTHSFLWFVDGNEKLSITAKETIEDSANNKFLSIASLWELAIKLSIGKLGITQPFEKFIPQQLQTNGFQLFEITFEHLVKTTRIPFHHRDPFDRLLAAQCPTEDIPIISADSIFDDYAVRRLW